MTPTWLMSIDWCKELRTTPDWLMLADCHGMLLPRPFLPPVETVSWYKHMLVSPDWLMLADCHGVMLPRPFLPPVETVSWHKHMLISLPQSCFHSRWTPHAGGLHKCHSFLPFLTKNDNGMIWLVANRIVFSLLIPDLRKRVVCVLHSLRML